MPTLRARAARSRLRFTVATAMLAPITSASGGDMMVQFLLGSLTTQMALFGPGAMVGIASGVGGGYLASMLQMRMISGARQGGRMALAVGQSALSRIQAQGGDPAFSAAAKRLGTQVAPGAGTDNVRRAGHVAFRMPAVETPKGAAPNATVARYTRSGQLGGDAAARTRAGIRAGAMMAQADGLAREGQHDAANRMRGRARLQRAFAAGEDIRRAPRFGTGRVDPATGCRVVSARGKERRAIYAHAFQETRARHIAEQKHLKVAILSDQQLLAGEAPAGAALERHAAAERLRVNQARLTALSQTRG
jgi:hypothetical protein